MIPRCTFRMGGGRTCDTILELYTDRIGRVREHCPRCARRKAGICQDCPRPVAGKVGMALRCEPHRKKALLRTHNRWYHRDIDHARAIYRDVAARKRVAQRGGRPPMDPREVGRRCGLARAAALTPERRKEIAKLAVAARWAKHRAMQAAA